MLAFPKGLEGLHMGIAESHVVTSHITWVFAYMYIRTLLDTMRFKAVMAMNLSELRN
jgi:hypothetical protein